MKDTIAAPVRTFRPLSEEAYDVLRAAILGGRLQPSDRIVEADIARQMATSRSPIREAVRKLEHEGLVQYVPRRGTVVVGLSRADVADAYQLRAHLEAYGARLAATRATAEHLARLLELIGRMRECAASGDLDGLVAADVDFHRLVCAASGSPRLLQAWETLNPARWTLVSGLRATDLSLEQIAERHRPILAALQSRKPDNAANIIGSHILELGERVLAGLAETATESEAQNSLAPREVQGEKRNSLAPREVKGEKRNSLAPREVQGEKRNSLAPRTGRGPG